MGAAVGRAAEKTGDPHSDALDVLHKAIADYEKNPGAYRTNVPVKPPPPAPAKTEVPAKTAAPSATPPPTAVATAAPAQGGLSFAEMEQMYLDGKISAKQFQKYLQERKIPPVTTKEATDATAPGTPPRAPAPPAAQPAAPGQGAVSDVEKRLDDLLRAKTEREKAATNTVSSAQTGAKTKRQRLDDLLRQLIEGKISDDEYRKQREKIIAEPDEKPPQ